MCATAIMYGFDILFGFFVAGTSKKGGKSSGKGAGDQTQGVDEITESIKVTNHY